MLSSVWPMSDDPYQRNRWWGPNSALGLFMQRRAEPLETVMLALVTVQEETLVKVQRVTNSELVLARYPEKGMRADTVKFFFDPVKRMLVKQIRYAPFAGRRIVEQGGIPYLLADDGHSVVMIHPAEDGFELAGGAEVEVAPEEFRPARFGSFELTEEPDPAWGKRKVIAQRSGEKTVAVPLPQTTLVDFLRLRPEALQSGWRPSSGNIREDIGPHELTGNQLWFGKTFYDGEGETGAGAFGYFDGATGQYILFSPPEVRRWSISAILVESDAVWVALVHRGEYGDTGGGLLRWDRSSQRVKQYPVSPVVHAMARYQGRLYLGTSDGVAVLQDGPARQFFVDVGMDGKRQVVESRP